MASIEYIQKRIEGKEKEIAKLEKKLERITKAKESNWEINPYYYGERDFNYVTKDLSQARVALQNYKDQLEVEVQKSNSRNIPAIVEFLEMWKQRVTEYYHEEFEKYLIARDKWFAYSKQYTDWSNSNGWRCRKENPEEYKAREKEYRDRKKAYTARWNFLFGYVENKVFNEDKFQKMLNREADAKYDFIIERTNAIVGTITDATNLEIGAKGDLNGYIIGTNGTAKVQTVGAGGYNIQCFHFRTLIHKMN